MSFVGATLLCLGGRLSFVGSVSSFMGGGLVGGFICGRCRSFMGGVLMFVGGGLMFVGPDHHMGSGCRSAMGAAFSSCCCCAVLFMWLLGEGDGKWMGTHLNNLDNVAQLPRCLHHPHIVAVVVCVVIHVCRGGCGRSIMAVGTGGRW